VFGMLGRVPVEGESIELDGLTITIERVQGRRVGKVLVAASPGSDADPLAAPDDDDPSPDRSQITDPTTKASR
jgi:Mg2+/Co2+ transporter CorC